MVCLHHGAAVRQNLARASGLRLLPFTLQDGCACPSTVFGPKDLPPPWPPSLLYSCLLRSSVAPRHPCISSSHGIPPSHLTAAPRNCFTSRHRHTKESLHSSPPHSPKPTLHIASSCHPLLYPPPFPSPTPPRHLSSQRRRRTPDTSTTFCARC